MLIHDNLLFFRYIVGMSAFSIGVLFNLITLIVLPCAGMLKYSTGVYVFFLCISDIIFLVS